MRAQNINGHVKGLQWCCRMKMIIRCSPSCPLSLSSVPLGLLRVWCPPFPGIRSTKLLNLTLDLSASATAGMAGCHVTDLTAANLCCCWLYSAEECQQQQMSAFSVSPSIKQKIVVAFLFYSLWCSAIMKVEIRHRKDAGAHFSSHIVLSWR